VEWGGKSLYSVQNICGGTLHFELQSYGSKVVCVQRDFRSEDISASCVVTVESVDFLLMT
jgi:hypothetical protein